MYTKTPLEGTGGSLQPQRQQRPRRRPRVERRPSTKAVKVKPRPIKWYYCSLCKFFRVESFHDAISLAYYAVELFVTFGLIHVAHEIAQRG